MTGIVRGPDGSFAITAPDLPEPAASECRRRMNLILRSEQQQVLRVAGNG